MDLEVAGNERSTADDNDMMDDKVRGQYASQILDNPVFKSACDVLQKETVDAWATCPARDVDGKEYLWKLYKANEKFLNIFRGYVEAGKLQELREKEEQSALQRAKDNVTKFAQSFRR